MLSMWLHTDKGWFFIYYHSLLPKHPLTG